MDADARAARTEAFVILKNKALGTLGKPSSPFFTVRLALVNKNYLEYKIWILT